MICGQARISSRSVEDYDGYIGQFLPKMSMPFIIKRIDLVYLTKTGGRKSHPTPFRASQSINLNGMRMQASPLGIRKTVLEKGHPFQNKRGTFLFNIGDHLGTGALYFTRPLTDKYNIPEI